MKRTLLLFVCSAAVITTVATYKTRAQDDNPPLPGYFDVRPWAGGGGGTTAQAAIAGSIPMSNYSFLATKDGSVRNGMIIGRSPFSNGKTTTTINVVLVPIVMTIGATTFDSTAVETCGNGALHGLTDVQLLQQSPLFDTLPWTLNGVNVGTTQYGDAIRRGEFWSIVGGTNYHTKLNVTVNPTVTISAATVGTHGIINGTGCGTLGIVATTWFQNLLETTIIPGLPGAGPTTFPLFVLRNIVQSFTDPPTTGSCCILGFHGTFGAPPQTYSPTEYDTSGRFTGIADSSILAHEVLEWFNDPLGNNPTPPWGGIGQVTGCQGNLEEGDPLTGTNMPPVVGTNGVTYHVQEIPFFSWFFNSQFVPSLGTGGKFSANGTFGGPSKVCPPGGTF